jgi:hypothetical protein
MDTESFVRRQKQGGRYPGGGGTFPTLAGLVGPVPRKGIRRKVGWDTHRIFVGEGASGYLTVAVSKQDFQAREFEASFLVIVNKALFKSAFEAGNDGIQLLSSTQRTEAQLIVPELGDKVLRH